MAASSSGGHPTAGDRAAKLARTFVDEWVRGGVREACLAPGSRSTPLALALAEDARVRLNVFLDERSAAFFALGTAKASGRPAVVLCTSGTATANFLPAVVEAAMARVPLVVATADRPPELQGVGAPQTIDQRGLYGTYTRWSWEVGVPDGRPGSGPYWRSVAARSVAEAAGAAGGPAGPVHLNFAFREPLVPSGAARAAEAEPGRVGALPWTSVTPGRVVLAAPDAVRLAADVRGADRGLLVVGWDSGAGVEVGTLERFARLAGWPVLVDPISSVRTGEHVVSTYEALCRTPAFADAHLPDLVVRVGAPLTSKVAGAWLERARRTVVLDPFGSWADPVRGAHELVAADPSDALRALGDLLEAEAGPGGGAAATAWVDTWAKAEAVARAAIDDLLDGWGEPFEGRVARDVAAALPDGSTLVVASSMPVRDLESFARPREGLRVLANRGANGIDGFTSTALGVAAASEGPTVAVMGDLAFLHDQGALFGAPRRGVDAVVVVLDNGGGGIFSFLPQAGLPEHFETLFGTPHGLDLLALASAHGVPATRVGCADEVVPAVEDALAGGGLRVVIVPTDREVNVRRHREVWEVVARALGA